MKQWVVWELLLLTSVGIAYLLGEWVWVLPVVVGLGWVGYAFWKWIAAKGVAR